MKHTIRSITGREILNAKGKPTVEVELVTNTGILVTASVPSGTSTGKYEAQELYDGGERYHGCGTRKAAAHVSGEINRALQGRDVTRQRELDALMCSLDGTENKSRLGANAILAASVALSKAGAIASGEHLYHYLAGNGACSLPDIVATVISGGAYSPSGLEFEDYMLLLSGFDSFSSQLEALVSIRLLLEKMLRKQYAGFQEDGGALAAPLKSSAEAFECMLKAAETLGYQNHVALGLDVAASELYCSDGDIYNISKGKVGRLQLVEYYQELCGRYPLQFIEDGFEQDDFAGFHLLKKAMPDIQIVGDDLFATNVTRLHKGIEKDCANALLLKINQVGTVTESLDAASLARKHGYDVVVSLRSGETNDSFIADLAVGIGARQIKLGSPVRAERNAKYNRLLRIAEELEGNDRR